MGLVWMAKFLLFKILKKNNGQSAVEYILLLAVISSLMFTIFRSERFKQLFQGQSGLFANIRQGMMYSYRYGLDIRYNNSPDMNFQYGSNAHDTYTKGGASRFFSSKGAYPPL